MRIWIDGYEANQVQRVGSGQYGFEILKNIEKIDNKNDFTILLPNSPLSDLPRERKNWKYRVLKPTKLWTRIALPLALYLSRNKPDVFFSPTHYIPRFSSVRKVCTIFDLAFLHFPEMFKTRDLWQMKLWTKYSIENSDKILTISEFTKQDIIKNYNVNPQKVIVTPLGYDKEIFKPVKNIGKIKKPYIIFIGTIQPRKNLIRLMEAFKKIENDINLVIVGKTAGAGRQGWMFKDILETPKRLGIENRVEFKGFVPTKELPALLSGAECFVLPSLWEGFGIPVLEAMACGTPVVVSNVSSLPEVAGDAGVLVDPYNIEDIANGIKKALENKQLLSKKGLLRVKQFSWQAAAQQTLKVLYN